MKMQRKVQPALSHLLVQVQDGFQLGRTVDIQWPCPTEQIEGGHQPWKSEVMVTMQMGNADVVDPHHADPLVPQRNLRPFTTVKQELLFMYVDDLRCGIPSRKRKGCTTTEDVDLEAQGRQCWISTRRTSLPSPR